LSEAVTVVGSIRPEELEAYYRTADVFVCASDHEGFCVPIVEAMAHDLPVVAYGVAAVPETVQDAGLLLGSKDPLGFAAAVHRVMDDEPLRRQFSRAAARRVEVFSLARARAHFVDLVLGVVGS
jgi:glycosyltransferase involved in cell wall biosynthesis